MNVAGIGSTLVFFDASDLCCLAFCRILVGTLEEVDPVLQLTSRRASVRQLEAEFGAEPLPFKRCLRNPVFTHFQYLVCVTIFLIVFATGSLSVFLRSRQTSCSRYLFQTTSLSAKSRIEVSETLLDPCSYKHVDPIPMRLRRKCVRWPGGLASSRRISSSSVSSLFSFSAPSFSLREGFLFFALLGRPLPGGFLRTGSTSISSPSTWTATFLTLSWDCPLRSVRKFS